MYRNVYNLMRQHGNEKNKYTNQYHRGGDNERGY